MINARGLAVLLALALLAFGITQSRAAEDKPPIAIRHQAPGHVTCQVIRDFVAMVGPEKAEQMAKASGQSEERIAAGRRCLRESR